MQAMKFNGIYLQLEGYDIRMEVSPKLNQSRLMIKYKQQLDKMSLQQKVECASKDLESFDHTKHDSYETFWLKYLFHMDPVFIAFLKQEPNRREEILSAFQAVVSHQSLRRITLGYQWIIKNLRNLMERQKTQQRIAKEKQAKKELVKPNKISQIGKGVQLEGNNRRMEVSPKLNQSRLMIKYRQQLDKMSQQQKVECASKDLESFDHTKHDSYETFWLKYLFHMDPVFIAFLKQEPNRREEILSAFQAVVSHQSLRRITLGYQWIIKNLRNLMERQKTQQRIAKEKQAKKELVKPNKISQIGKGVSKALIARIKPKPKQKQKVEKTGLSGKGLMPLSDSEDETTSLMPSQV